MHSRKSRASAPDWSKLLVEAVNTPGVLSDAYRRFWEYSIGNQLLALFECLQRGIEPGPIHTFKGWLDLGRHVRKGEKAITLCMPVKVKTKGKRGDKVSAKHEVTLETSSDDGDTGETNGGSGTKTVFVFRPHWFVLSQTDGAPYVPTELPAWSEARALKGLQVERVAFRHPNGNCQGYASKRQVAVSPIAMLPHKTLFHELAHVVIGHTAEGLLDDDERTPMSLREVEAECVALICCESLGLPGIPECRGYVQHWFGRSHGNESAIPNQSVQRIFRTADVILKAGRDNKPVPSD